MTNNSNFHLSDYGNLPQGDRLLIDDIFFQSKNKFEQICENFLLDPQTEEEFLFDFLTELENCDTQIRTIYFDPDLRQARISEIDIGVRVLPGSDSCDD